MNPAGGFEILDPEECRHLLGQVEVGRVALSVRAMPVVVPVKVGLLTDALVVCSDLDSSFQAACNNAIVAFEADGSAGPTHLGWCVMVQGRAQLLDPAVDIDPAAWVSGPPWSDHSPDGGAVRIGLDVVSGHRVIDPRRL